MGAFPSKSSRQSVASFSSELLADHGFRFFASIAPCIRFDVESSCFASTAPGVVRKFRQSTSPGPTSAEGDEDLGKM